MWRKGILAIIGACWLAGAAQAEPARVRAGITDAGPALIVGDLRIAAVPVFSTDDRYDNVNTRARALRLEWDAYEAKRRGERPESPVVQMMRRRAQAVQDDPGFQVASTARQEIQEAGAPQQAQPDGAVWCSKKAASAACTAPAVVLHLKRSKCKTGESHEKHAHVRLCRLPGRRAGTHPG